MKMLARAGLALSALIAGPVFAATIPVPNCLISPNIVRPCTGAAATDPATGNPMPVRETFRLATGNAPSAAQTVNGGTYIFAQMATGYGTVALQVLGPDSATWETVASKTQADSTGGTAIQLQAGAMVRALLTGTTGANVTLGRVP